MRVPDEEIGRARVLEQLQDLELAAIEFPAAATAAAATTTASVDTHPVLQHLKTKQTIVMGFSNLPFLSFFLWSWQTKLKEILLLFRRDLYFFFYSLEIVSYFTIPPARAGLKRLEEKILSVLYFFQQSRICRIYILESCLKIFSLIFYLFYVCCRFLKILLIKKKFISYIRKNDNVVLVVLVSDYAKTVTTPQGR